MNDVLPLIEEFSKDMSDPEVQKAINNLPKTLEQLSEIQKTIDDNQELIDGLAKLMSKENVQKLNDLIDSIDSGDYAGKLQKYGVLAEDADDLIAKLQSMISYGASYDIYTEKTAGTESNVMFIYQTAPIASSSSASTAPSAALCARWATMRSSPIPSSARPITIRSACRRIPRCATP